MRYENNPMKTQLKLISCFAVMAIACGSLCFTASVRAQSAPQPTVDPNANKKEAPAAPAPSASPTATPKQLDSPLLQASGHPGHSEAQMRHERFVAGRKSHHREVQLRIDSGDLQPQGSWMS